MTINALFLVLSSDGSLSAYSREDILLVALAQHLKAGDPARQVYELERDSLTVTYKPAPQYAEFTLPLSSLCQRHAVRAVRNLFGLMRRVGPSCVECNRTEAK